MATFVGYSGGMPELTTSSVKVPLPVDVKAKLREAAKRSRRSMQAQALVWIEQAAEREAPGTVSPAPEATTRAS